MRYNLDRILSESVMLLMRFICNKKFHNKRNSAYNLQPFKIKCELNDKKGDFYFVPDIYSSFSVINWVTRTKIAIFTSNSFLNLTGRFDSCPESGYNLLICGRVLCIFIQKKMNITLLLSKKLHTAYAIKFRRPYGLLLTLYFKHIKIEYTRTNQGSKCYF